MKRVTVYLSDEEYEELRRYAFERRRSMSTQLKEALPVTLLFSHPIVDADALHRQTVTPTIEKK